MAIVDLTRRARLATLVSAAANAVPFALRLALAAALAWPAAAHAETAMHFTLDRKIDGPVTPFFLAIDKGYFKAEGLDVTVDTAAASPVDALNRVAAGKDQMGVADINVLIQMRDAAATPIKALFIVFDKPAYAIIARKSRGIAAPRNLVGKKVAAPAADPAVAQWPVFAKVNDIDPAKVMLENVGLPVREPMLAAGEVDAVIGSSFTSYVDLKARGVPPDDLAILPMADYGLVLYGDAIVVAAKFAEEKPEAVRAFVLAYLQALRETVRDPARAIDALLRRTEGVKKEIELERLRMAIRDNIVTPAVRSNGYGAIDPARFAAAIDQIALGYRFKAKETAAAAFDASFLPQAAQRSMDDTASR